MSIISHIDTLQHLVVDIAIALALILSNFKIKQQHIFQKHHKESIHLFGNQSSFRLMFQLDQIFICHV